jgi:hypothetical protein
VPQVYVQLSLRSSQLNVDGGLARPNSEPTVKRAYKSRTDCDTCHHLPVSRCHDALAPTAAAEGRGGSEAPSAVHIELQSAGLSSSVWSMHTCALLLRCLIFMQCDEHVMTSLLT